MFFIRKILRVFAAITLFTTTFGTATIAVFTVATVTLLTFTVGALTGIHKLYGFGLYQRLKNV